ncbi:serine hydrolase [Streptomyces sp. NPDC046985]|uniref:serine hydrolase n=1 Tax=Streptomyces sp. NPDC046985 TaxID=3155377 RepID=UPI0033DFF175
MSHPCPAAPARTAAGRRGPRAVVVLLSAVTALVSLGALHAPPAAAAPADPAATPPRTGPKAQPRVTAAVLDLDGTGRVPTVHGADAHYDTASIIKVDILATLLLQAQDAGRRLTPQERAQAEPMIRHSDNAAANALWREIGRAPGLQAANKRLGLITTQGGPGPAWGLTRTTASDQIRLLRAVFDHGAGPAGAPALGERSRAYIRSLMSRIADEQSWGVSAAAGSSWELKNGWLQRTTTGLWDVNSVGRVSKGGRHYLVAVLSDGNATMGDGVSRVEKAARAAVAAASAR